MEENEEVSSYPRDIFLERIKLGLRLYFDGKSETKAAAESNITRGTLKR